MNYTTEPTENELFAALNSSILNKELKENQIEDNKKYNYECLSSFFGGYNYGVACQKWQSNRVILTEEGVRVDISSKEAMKGLIYAYTLNKEKGLDVLANLKGYLGEETFSRFARLSLGQALKDEGKIKDLNEFCTKPNREIYPDNTGDGKTDGSIAGVSFDCKYNTNPKSTKVWVSKQTILADKIKSIHIGIKPCFDNFDETIVDLIKSGKTIPHMIYGYVDQIDVSGAKRFMENSDKKGSYIQGRNGIYRFFYEAASRI